MKESDHKTKQKQEEAIQGRIKELEISLQLANNHYKVATAGVESIQKENVSAYKEPIGALIEPGMFILNSLDDVC